MTSDTKVSKRFTGKMKNWVPPRYQRERRKSPDWGPRVTKQEFKSESDINNIMKKYKDTGAVTHVNDLQGQFGDFTQAMDYHSSMNKITQAKSSFAALPANVRKHFQNDPAKLVTFVQDPKNRTKAARMGLLTKEATVKVARDVIAKRQAARAAKPDPKDQEIAQLKESLAKAQKT